MFRRRPTKRQTRRPAKRLTKRLMRRQIAALFAFLVLAIGVSPCPPTMAGESTDFDSLKQRLIDDGFDKAAIEKLYVESRVAFDAKGVSLFLMHREAVLNYDQFAAPKYIRRAKKYMRDHATELLSAEKTYGVDKTVITAILLVETKLGSYLGGRSILNTLSTMASITEPRLLERVWSEIPEQRRFPRQKFEKRAQRKAKWAYTEVKALLLYTERERIDPADIRGSYAGAMGIAQFMPSSVMAYAKDGNGDGRIDLFTHADSIASIAGYLKSYGWRPGIDEKKAYKVVYQYNHSKYYVATVLKIAGMLKGE